MLGENWDTPRHRPYLGVVEGSMELGKCAHHPATCSGCQRLSPRRGLVHHSYWVLKGQTAQVFRTSEEFGSRPALPKLSS